MCDSEIMVSVIVLTYEHARFVRQALESILCQKTTFTYEILVGDDASTDGTDEIVRMYEHFYPQVRAFVRKQNIGATKNLYELLLLARGKYIANCEGDDYWCDDRKLQMQVEFLEHHPEYSACTHACRIVDENGMVLKGRHLKWVCKKEEYSLQDFRGRYLPGQPASLVHRNFFLNRKHDYSIIYQANSIVADRTIVMILAAQGHIRRFSDVMSCYRVREMSTDSATVRAFRDNPDVNRMQYEFTCMLERYLEDEFGIHIRFNFFKYTQRLKGWIKSRINTIYTNLVAVLQRSLN